MVDMKQWRENIERWLNQVWYQNSAWVYLLLPLSKLYFWLSHQYKARYLDGRKTMQSLRVPVIVVGNITVGGTGKTPVVIALVEHLRQRGWKVGVISRGYGGQATQFPLRVNQSVSPSLCGDEPRMIFDRTGVSVVVDPDRVRGARFLLSHDPVDIIVSDDGLQHWAMKRDLEIVVVDGQRLFGNFQLLPAGPLREPIERLAQVDFVLVNGDPQWVFPVPYNLVNLTPTGFIAVKPHLKTNSLDEFKTLYPKVHAVAGIGNPQRFFDSLRKLGIEVIEHPFPDHHFYSKDDLKFDDTYPVVMTEKDAVKCASFASDNWWYLAVTAQLETRFLAELDNRLNSKKVIRV
ncbi:MAG TPA: tetraacyldisaccharide 4'-kinase [Pseudomonadales bacterium]|nr:tetraacyldisaccharide 4'-kinase [Pseudomonadales bacterium]